MRSLAGLIGFVGLLRPERAIQRRVERAFRLYEAGDRDRAAAFRALHGHDEAARIDLVGVWDTVKALGIPWPVLSFLHPMATEFHDHHLGAHVGHGLHALALDEDRVAFRPEVWRLDHLHPGRVEQVWFPGSHGDVGGHIGHFRAARGVADLSLSWMLERSEALGLPLPPDWRDRVHPDAAAPMRGSRRGSGQMFLIRERRRVHPENGEVLHPSAALRMVRLGYRPLARGVSPPPPLPRPPPEARAPPSAGRGRMSRRPPPPSPASPRRPEPLRRRDLPPANARSSCFAAPCRHEKLHSAPARAYPSAYGQERPPR